MLENPYLTFGFSRIKGVSEFSHYHAQVWNAAHFTRTSQDAMKKGSGLHITDSLVIEGGKGGTTHYVSKRGVYSSPGRAKGL